ncbi:glutathione s-transferase u8 [Quercus suber]|uniref:glutathione transferase n=1 Tax=Quercus suber TaxID=58331 RepID=A0AAW0LGN0_QUESU
MYCLPAIFKACWGEEREHEKAVKEASELLEFLENELKEKRYFGGETVGLLDIAANTIGYWLGVFEEASGVEMLTREKFPKLCNWANEFVCVTAVKENLPPRDKLIAYFRNRFGVVVREKRYNSSTKKKRRKTYLSAIWKSCTCEKEEREKAVEETSELLQFLENELKEQKYFGGETIGLVDIAANIIGYWLEIFEEAFGVELLRKEKFPKLCNWASEFVSVSAIKENLPPSDKLIAFLQNRFGVGNASK